MFLIFPFFSASLRQLVGDFSVLFVHSSYIHSWRQPKLCDHNGQRKEEPMKSHLKWQKSFYFLGNNIPLLDVMATKIQWPLPTSLGCSKAGPYSWSPVLEF
jgi:hypothetical protein